MGEQDEQIVFEMGYNKGFKDGIKGSIPKDQYEARLKADMVAMLTELLLEIEQCGVEDSHWIIKEKINALKENKE